MEYLGRIVLATPYEQQHAVRAGPVAVSVDGRDTAPCLVGDAIGYLLPLVRKDEKLDGLLVGHDKTVGDIGVDKYGHPTVDYSLGAGLYAGLHIAVKRQKKRCGDNRHVHNHHGAPDTYRTHALHHRRDYISAAGGAVMAVIDADAYTEQHSSHKHTHSHVAHKRGTRHKISFHRSDDKRQHGEAKHGLDDKISPYVTECAQQQQQVAAIHGHRHRDAFAREIVH